MMIYDAVEPEMSTDVDANGCVRWSIPLDISPQSIVFTPSGEHAYVLDCFNGGGGVVAMLNIDALGNVTDSGFRTLPLGTTECLFGVDQLAVTSDGAFVLVHTPGFVHLIDTSTNVVTSSIPLIGDVGSGEHDGGGIAIIQ